ncbi:MAG: ABC transporter ATP-binding protein [Bacillota bacterium]
MHKKTFRRIFTAMKGVRKLYFIGVLGMSLAMFLFQTRIALMFRTLFDTLETGDFSTAIDNITGDLVFILITFLLFPLFTYLAYKATVHTTGFIRKKAFHKLTKLPIQYFKERHSAEISSRLTNDIAEMERAYTEHLMRFMVNLITGIGTGIVMFFIEWRLALFALIGALVSYGFNSLYAKRLRHVSRNVQKHLGILNTKLSNIISGIRVIRIFNIQTHILNKFIRSNEDVYKHSKDKINKQATIDGLNALLGVASFIGLTGFGAYLVLNGLTTVGVIIAIVQLQNGVTSLIRSLGTFISSMQSSLAAGERVFETLDEDEEPKHYAYVPLSMREASALELDGIRFAYDEAYVLNGISLTLKKGETAALVGPSGGGKSTLFKLLLQFHEANAGSMVINGKNPKTTPLKAIRKSISYVPQDAHVFQGTVRENIAYGALDKDETAIINAAKDANAHTFIESLKDGYNTVIGENGTTLSGGQRQRIAIARAILKDAPILLLDEATSALDNTSEKIIQEALLRLMENKTALIIAHRLSTIKHSDTIFVIDEGKVKEKGSHQALMKSKGLYAELVENQLKPA